MSQASFDERQGGYRVFVGNLASRTDPNEFQKECERYGRLVNCWVARNPPGFAFLVYEKADDASAAVRNMNGSLFCGQPIRVEHAKARLVTTRNIPTRDDEHRRERSRRRSHSRSRSRKGSKKRSSRHRRRSSSNSSRSSTPKRKHRSHSDDSSSDRNGRHTQRHHRRQTSKDQKRSSDSNERPHSTSTNDNQSTHANTEINHSN